MPGTWTRYETDSGQRYYCHDETGATTWEEPPEEERWKVQSNGAADYFYNVVTDDTSLENPVSTPVDATPERRKVPPPRAEPVPPNAHAGERESPERHPFSNTAKN